MTKITKRNSFLIRFEDEVRMGAGHVSGTDSYLEVWEEYGQFYMSMSDTSPALTQKNTRALVRWFNARLAGRPE